VPCRVVKEFGRERVRGGNEKPQVKPGRMLADRAAGARLLLPSHSDRGRTAAGT
jgi:hypothetical protein